MNKEQAQNYINKVGKGYVLLTRNMNCLPHIYVFAVLFVVTMVLCHTVSMVIISCALFATLIVFLSVTVRRYMSMLRLGAYYCGVSSIWIAMLNCITFAIQYHESAFIVWGFFVPVAIQAVLFVVTFASITVYVNDATRKKIILISVGVAGVVCSALSQTFAYITVPNTAPEILAFSVVFISVACLLAMLGATTAVRIYIMRKYKIKYKPEWQSVYDYSNKARFEGLGPFRGVSPYNVHCFEYKSYRLFIYAKLMGKCKLLVFDGNTFIKKEKYKNIDELFANAEIGHCKLTKIWGSVKPL